MYESTKFDFYSGELLLKARNNALFNCVYIIDERDPEISVSVNADHFSYSETQDADYYACPTDQIATELCDTTYKGFEWHYAYFEYSFTGVKFEIFGKKKRLHTFCSLFR